MIGVVLGGGLEADGAPAAMTVRRAGAALGLARSRPEVALVLCGSRGGWELPAPARSEAAWMRELLLAAGVPAARLLLEDESRDTLGNGALAAVRYLRGLGPRPVWVISSPFHLPRAVEVFRRVLGPGWDELRGLAAAEGPGDQLLATNEPALLATTAAFFAGLAPGDLPAIARRLRERYPSYRRVARLAL